MAFCSFSNEYDKEKILPLDSNFITDYLPEASGDAVRVYLYGLFVCRMQKDSTLQGIASELNLSEETVIDCFKFWEEYDLVSIISDNPFTVRYLPLSKQGKPRKFKPEKYTEFTNSLQALLPDRMISTGEYSAYFNLMEEYSIKPEAMLMICKYCVDLKGASIGYRYIIAVAKDFASRGIITTELIEKELSDYMVRSEDISAIISALGLKRKPEIEDLQFYNKWKSQLGFEQRVLLFIAKKCKRKNINALDEFIHELFSNKLFTEKEIDAYLKERESYKELAFKVCKALSVYVEVVDPVVENYILPWTAKGYDGDTLEFLANWCFKKNRRTLPLLNDQIEMLYDKGLITLSSIAEYVKGLAKHDEFIKEILSSCQLDRRPNDSDRQLLTTWYNWGFSSDMIKEACRVSSGKLRPLVYMNAILSDWKTQGIFTKENIPQSQNTATVCQKTNHFANERTYTKEELDALIDSVDDIKF